MSWGGRSLPHFGRISGATGAGQTSKTHPQNPYSGERFLLEPGQVIMIDSYSSGLQIAILEVWG